MQVTHAHIEKNRHTGILECCRSYRQPTDNQEDEQMHQQVCKKQHNNLYSIKKTHLGNYVMSCVMPYSLEQGGGQGDQKNHKHKDILSNSLLTFLIICTYFASSCFLMFQCLFSIVKAGQPTF